MSIATIPEIAITLSPAITTTGLEFDEDRLSRSRPTIAQSVVTKIHVTARPLR
jgi:hypothetical protein